jgi:hypothetical protein
MARESHGHGWDIHLPTLAAVAAGAPAQRQRPLTAGEELASQLNTLLVHLRWFIERCDEATWRSPCPDDGRTVGVVAKHIVSHVSLADFAIATGAGQRSPLADFTAETLEQMNAAAAQQFANVTPAEVLAELKSAGPAGVERLKALNENDLTGTQPMAFAGGAPLSGNDLAHGPLLGDIAEHVAHLESVA